jgi:hypothetical protein
MSEGEDGPMSEYEERLSELLQAQRAVDRARDDVQRLERELEVMVPEEPDSSSVVLWSGRFSGGRPYRFASIDAGGGVWYTTGDTTRQGITWEQLVSIMRGRSARTYTVLRRDGIRMGAREETVQLS